MIRISRRSRIRDFRRASGSGAWRWFFCTIVLFGDLSAETLTDTALWAGGIVLFEDQMKLDYSVEYQARFDENVSSLNNHFLELQAYRKTAPSLLVTGAYRFTHRSSHNDHRLYLGGFWDLTRSVQKDQYAPERLRVILQFGYQHDFNAEFDGTLMGSNSVRFVFVASRQVTEKVRPLLLAGVLTTWNDAYSYGVDKIRLGGGFVARVTDQRRFRVQYIWEKAYFRSPNTQTNIFWLRYEANFGD